MVIRELFIEMRNFMVFEGFCQNACSKLKMVLVKATTINIKGFKRGEVP
jgi:hypothetical protein